MILFLEEFSKLDISLGGFLESNEGANPSLIWMSIFSIKVLLKKGAQSVVFQ